MLLLLLLVTPLVDAGGDSCSTPCTCTLPEPLKMVNSTECTVGIWYGLYSCGDKTCFSETFIDIGDKRLNTSVTVIIKNECSQIYYGTSTLGTNNVFMSIVPCKPEWNGDYVLLATDCKTYAIYGVCKPGSCEPVYFIAFKSMTPRDCTVNKVEKDLTCLALDWTIFNQNC